MELSISEKIRLLREKINDLQARFPAHSIPSAMIIELDELEGELDSLLAQQKMEASDNLKDS